MKVSCSQKRLAEGLAVVNRAVASRSTMPVLSNVYVDADDDRLKLMATDMEIGIVAQVDARVVEPGRITVPARVITDLVNSSPPTQIDVTADPNTQILRIQCDQFLSQLKGIPASEFPSIPDPDPQLTDALRVPPVALQKMIAQTAFAAAKDQTRPVLTGVLMEIQDSTLTMVATDGFRVSVSVSPLLNVPQLTSNVIVPARALQELTRVSRSQVIPVDVLIAPNQVSFLMTDVTLTSLCIEGQFPDYQQILPEDFTTRVTVNTTEFLHAARRAYIFTRDNYNMTHLQISASSETQSSRLRVVAVATELGDNVETIEADVVGVDVDVAFNAQYLIDVLNVIDATEVVVDIASATKPALLRPVNDAGFVHAIMPMAEGM